jgi:hypothetical protein
MRTKLINRVIDAIAFTEIIPPLCLLIADYTIDKVVMVLPRLYVTKNNYIYVDECVIFQPKIWNYDLYYYTWNMLLFINETGYESLIQLVAETTEYGTAWAAAWLHQCIELPASCNLCNITRYRTSRISGCVTFVKDTNIDPRLLGYIHKNNQIPRDDSYLHNYKNYNWKRDDIKYASFTYKTYKLTNTSGFGIIRWSDICSCLNVNDNHYYFQSEQEAIDWLLTTDNWVIC